MPDVNIQTVSGHDKPQPLHQATAHSDILAWLDTIPLSRPILNFDKDFSDGILVAEIISFFFPEYVDLDMFYTARNMSQRTTNWRILKSDLLPKLGLHAPGTVVHEITHGDNRVTELFLLYLREKIEEHLIDTERKSRLSVETYDPLNVERDRLPQLMLTPRIPRRKGLIPGSSSLNMGREHTNSYMHNDALKAKEKEIDVLSRKLNRCENLIQAKDERIQELEELVEKLKSNRSSS
jgi:hypothetical protein